MELSWGAENRECCRNKRNDITKSTANAEEYLKIIWNFKAGFKEIDKRVDKKIEEIEEKEKVGFAGVDLTKS